MVKPTLKQWVRSHHRVSLPIALAAGLLVVSAAHADHLISVGEVNGSGGAPFLALVTEAEQPNLKGTVLEDKVEPFDVTENVEGRGVFRLKGHVQVRVVGNDDGALTFYYRIYSDKQTSFAISEVGLDYNDPSSSMNSWPKLDIAARKDADGTIGPQWVSRDTSQTVNFLFGDSVFQPGISSRFLLVRLPGRLALTADPKSYKAGGHLTVYTQAVPRSRHGGKSIPRLAATIPIFVPVAPPALTIKGRRE